MQKSVAAGVGPLGLISASTHSKLLAAFIFSAFVSLLFLGLLIFFSYRFGRVGSPGCVVFLAAIPGFILMGGVRGWLSQAAQNPPAAGEETFFTRYAQLAVDVLPDVVQTAMQIYLFLIFMGLGLMLIALVGTVFIRDRKTKEIAPGPEL
jgi:hypothetical protein